MVAGVRKQWKYSIGFGSFIITLALLFTILIPFFTKEAQGLQIMGYTGTYNEVGNTNDYQRAYLVTASYSGSVKSISLKLKGDANGVAKFKCALYVYTDYSSSYAGALTAQTEEKTISFTASTDAWFEFNFSTLPAVVASTNYYIVMWSDYVSGGNLKIDRYYTSGTNKAWYRAVTYGSWPNPAVSETAQTDYRYCMYASYSRFPSINANTPANGTTGEMLSPVCNITIADPDGETMRVTWQENSTGSFVTRQVNSSCPNGTYRFSFIQAASYSTKYWWKAFVNDGYTNISYWYYFTTMAAPVQTAWYILSDTINGSFYNTTRWIVLTNNINGSFYNNTRWATIIDTVNGSFYNNTWWSICDDTMNGSFYNSTSWDILDDAINGSFYNDTIWRAISDTVNGSFYNVSDWTLISNTINGSFYNTTGWDIIDDAVNGSFCNLTAWAVLSDTINGSFYNVTSWSILIDTLNGSFYNISSASWKTLDGSINGSFYNSTAWIILVDTINGSFYNNTSWVIIINLINGSFYNISDWSIIINTINGSFWNGTFFHQVSSDINGSFYNNVGWSMVDDSINGSFYNVTLATPFSINLFVHNPNPGNGTHGTNYLRMNASGLTTSVDIWYNNFTSPPAMIPGSYSLVINGTPPANVPCLWNTSAVYATVWGTTNGIITPGSLPYVGQLFGAGTYDIFRSYLMFDTSILPDNAIIDSGYLSLIVWDDYSDTDFNVTIQIIKPPYFHDPLQIGDYWKFPYANDAGNLNTSGYTDEDFFNITLNATGLGTSDSINRMGMTKWGIRSAQDIASSAPTGNEFIIFYGYGLPASKYPKLILNYTVPSSNWQHIVNLTFYNMSSGLSYGSAHAVSNGTVTVSAPVFNGVGVYRWKVSYESNHTNQGNSTIWAFETVNLTGGGGGGILPIGGVGDASMNYLLLVSLGSFSICMIFFNRKRKKK